MIDNKAILQKANAAITSGDNEGFLSFCTEDTEWDFVGEQTLKGKPAVREWMEINYIEPPKFKVDNLIEDGDYLAALGTIQLKDKNGNTADHSYCDVWQFRDGKIVGLKAFVIKS